MPDLVKFDRNGKVDSYDATVARKWQEQGLGNIVADEPQAPEPEPEPAPVPEPVEKPVEKPAKPAAKAQKQNVIKKD
jgi:hypothetical protein